MHIQISQTSLTATLKKAVRFVSSKPQLPILSSFYLQTIQDTLCISATDLHVGIREHLACRVLKEGSCIVPAKVFLELIQAVKGEIELSVKDQMLSISTTQANAEIQTFPVSDYPPFPQKEGQQITLPTAVLARIVDQVGFAASTDETRPILTSVLLLPGENLRAVSTDGYRLSVLDTGFELPLNQHVLFPSKTLTEIIKSNLTGEKNVVLHISEGLKQAFFTFADTQIVVRTIDGEFPPFEKIIPSSFEITCEVEAEEFSEHLKTAMIFSRESSGIVQLHLQENELFIQANSAGVGKYESKIPAKNQSGKSIQIAFNGKYLMDFTSRIHGSLVRIKMNDSLKPAVFECDQDTGFLYVAMPFRVNAE